MSSAWAQAGSPSSSSLCPKDTCSEGSAWPHDPLGLPLLLSVPCLLASPWTRIWTVIILLDHSTLPTWPSHEHGHSIRAGIVSLCAVGGLPQILAQCPEQRTMSQWRKGVRLGVKRNSLFWDRKDGWGGSCTDRDLGWSTVDIRHLDIKWDLQLFNLYRALRRY